MDDKIIIEPCIKCGFNDLNEFSKFCPNCGEYLFNHCTNELCDYNNGQEVTLPNTYRYCDSCGAKTTFLDGGLLSDFKE